jgi:hypothetical protein
MKQTNPVYDVTFCLFDTHNYNFHPRPGLNWCFPFRFSESSTALIPHLHKCTMCSPHLIPLVPPHVYQAGHNGRSGSERLGYKLDEVSGFEYSVYKKIYIPHTCPDHFGVQSVSFKSGARSFLGGKATEVQSWPSVTSNTEAENGPYL